MSKFPIALIVLKFSGAFYGVCFLASGLLKARNHKEFAKTLESLGVPRSLQSSTTTLLVGLELSIGGLNLAISTVARRWAMAVLGSFSLVSIIAESQGKKPTCRCFGPLSEHQLGWQTVWRNCLLLVPGFAAELAHVSTASILRQRIRGTSARQTTPLRPTFAGVVLVTALGQIIYGVHIARTQQRILAELVKRAPSEPKRRRKSMPGQKLSQFPLYSLQGDKVDLRSIRLREDRLGVVFLDPVGCAQCLELLTPLRDLLSEFPDSATIAVITTKGQEEDEKEVYQDERGRSSDLFVLFQDGYEVIESLGVEKVPSALIASSDGTVVSDIAYGREEVIDLLRGTFGGE